jgi:hypothetical protein
MIPNRRCGAAQHFRYFGRFHSLHFAQHESTSLLRGQDLHDLAKDTVGLVAIGPQSGAFPRTDEAQAVFGPGFVRPLPTRARANQIDREIGSDPIDPGGEAVPGVVAIETLPRSEECHLHHIPCFGVVGEDSSNGSVEPPRVATDKLREGFFIAFKRSPNPLAVIHRDPAVVANTYDLCAHILPHHLSPYQFTEIGRPPLAPGRYFSGAQPGTTMLRWCRSRPLCWQLVEM